MVPRAHVKTVFVAPCAALQLSGILGFIISDQFLRPDKFYLFLEEFKNLHRLKEGREKYETTLRPLF
jgi:hypothetical protein